MVWDEAADPALALMTSSLGPPGFPTPLGVLRRVEAPSFEQGVVDQIQSEVDRRGTGSVHDLLHSGDTWKVEEAA